jgi:hypothetical protein
MKSLKFLGLALFALTIGFSSCESLNLNPSEDESAYLDFLYLATTNDSTGVTHKGKKCNVTEIEVSELPSPAAAYIADNYTGATISRAGETESGNFVVLITLADNTRRGLVFDSAGAFLKEGKGRGPKGEKVAISDLPSNVLSHIEATYAGATAKHAFVGPEGNFGVLILKADNTKLLLGYNADGTFIAELDLKGKGKGKRRGPFGK